eukprot:5863373-Prymnesium_polylepis.1
MGAADVRACACAVLCVVLGPGRAHLGVLLGHAATAATGGPRPTPTSPHACAPSGPHHTASLPPRKKALR